MEKITEEQITNSGGVGGLSVIEGGPPPVKDYIPWLDGDDIKPGRNYSKTAVLDQDWPEMCEAMKGRSFESKKTGQV